MIKSRLYIKWAAYGLLLILLYVLQMTPGLFPRFFGASPILIIPAVVVLSMFLSETEAAAFGLLCGLFWDVGGPFIIGFNAIILLVSCSVVSLLISFLMRNNIITALLLGSGILVLQALLWWFFFKVIWSYPGQWYLLLYNILPTIIYSILFIPPFYYGARTLCSRLEDVQ